MSERNYYYFNRELSWLEFNARVLEEGLDRSNPLLERLRFLSIVASNFDEFFMIRVAALKSRKRSLGDGTERDPMSGLTLDELLAAISRRTRELAARQYACLSHELLPELGKAGLCILDPYDWDIDSRAWLEQWFINQVEPLLTPVAVPPEGEGPFPLTGNLKIHAAFLLRHALDASQEQLVIIQVPSNINRFVRLPGRGDLCTRFVLLDNIVLAFGHLLFPGWLIKEKTLFKITRDADIGVDEDADDDFVAAMEKVLVDRQVSPPIRMTISADSEGLEPIISSRLGLAVEDIYPIDGPIDLGSFISLCNMKGQESSSIQNLSFDSFEASKQFDDSEDKTVFDELRNRDIVVHSPYDHYGTVLEFIEKAATDRATLAIKITLYRTSGDSPFVKALIKAARAGKQVTVVLELKARFDEQRNINWASRLEQAGAIVIYGLAKLKVHAKAAMVVRKEEDGQIRRYIHLSTGNYNDRTAKQYSDISLLSSSPALARDVADFFNSISGLSSIGELKHLAMAPYDLKRRIISMIDREAERSNAASRGLIIVKMNSLGDRDIINALYRASCAGVRIKLNIRGVCLLKPGIKGLSENIVVSSIVGRFLEHSRIIYFYNAGNEELYLSSADWMPRNLERRIELMFPVLEDEAKKRVKGFLDLYIADNKNARHLGPGGRWQKPEKSGKLSAQEELMKEARKRAAKNEGQGKHTRLKVRRKAP